MTQIDSAHLHSRTGNAAYEPVGPIQGVTDGASSVLNDAFDLAELQGKLFFTDGKECLRLAKLAFLGLIISLALLIASLPVVAFGLSQWLAWGLEWPLWLCQMIVGLTFTASGLIVGYLCVRRLRSSLVAFEASRSEASENIRWFRQALSRTFPI